MEKYLLSEDRKRIWLDDAAVYKAASSDPTVFRQLYLAHIRQIYRYIISKVGEVRQAEDLTSQVFLGALESLPRYRHDGHFAAWLFGIARHKLADYFRSRHVELPMEIMDEGSDKKDDLLSTLIKTEEAQHISKLVHQLNEQDKELLRLRLVAELSFGEIAPLIQSNVETTKKRYYRLLAHLRQQMEADHD